MQPLLLLTMVDMMVPLGTFIPLLPLFFQLFGFINTYSLTYTSFTILIIITNFPDKVILITVVTNNSVVVTYFYEGIN